MLSKPRNLGNSDDVYCLSGKTEKESPREGLDNMNMTDNMMDGDVSTQWTL